MAHGARSPARFFLGLPRGRGGAVLALVDDAAGQLPTPLVGDEAVTPEHEHAVYIIEHHRDRHAVEPDDVVFKSGSAAGRFDVDANQLDPGVVIDRALPVNAPPHGVGPVLAHESAAASDRGAQTK